MRIVAEAQDRVVDNRPVDFGHRACSQDLQEAAPVCVVLPREAHFDLPVGDDLLRLLLQAFQRSALFHTRLAVIVQGRHLKAEKDADNDDNEIQHDGEPVLVAHVVHQSSQQHYPGPESRRATIL